MKPDFREGPQRVPGKWAYVSVATDFACAIARDQALWCWGSNSNGGLGQGEGSGRLTSPARVGTGTDWVKLEVADSGSCGIRQAADGQRSLWCWNASDRVPTQVGEAGDWLAVTSEKGQAQCAVRGSAGEGTLLCRGYTELGATCSNQPLTPGTVADFTPCPSSVSPDVFDHDWHSVSSADARACAIKGEGELWCWGEGVQGQLAELGGGPFAYPQRIQPMRSWREVSVGANAVCARDTEDDVYCWGMNDRGQLGRGTVSASELPGKVSLPAKATSVQVGNTRACAILTNGDAACWGTNACGATAPSPLLYGTDTPTQIGTDTDWLRLLDARGTTVDESDCTSTSSPSRAACATKTNGSLYCWGDRLPFVGTDPWTAFVVSEPRLVSAPQLTEVQDLALIRDSNVGCAIGVSGDERRLWCFGSCETGYCGFDGSGFVAGTLHEVSVGGSVRTDWAELESGRGHFCARRDNGNVWCWGMGDLGQLGNASPLPPSPPAMIALPASTTAWIALAARANATCGLVEASDGTRLYCWGADEDVIGSCAYMSTMGEVWRVGTGTDWTAVALGDTGGCGLRGASNTLNCWGKNYSGEAAMGATGGVVCPEQTSVVNDGWSFVDQGRQICAARASGPSSELYCWGPPGKQRGLPLLTGNVGTPTRLDNDASWSQVYSSDGITFAVRSNHTLWGFGNHGVLFGLGVTTLATPHMLAPPD